MTQSSQLLNLSHIATESQWTILFGRMVSGFGIGMEGAVLGTIKNHVMTHVITHSPSAPPHFYANHVTLLFYLWAVIRYKTDMTSIRLIPGMIFRHVLFLDFF